jgi:hypothetical protein
VADVLLYAPGETRVVTSEGSSTHPVVSAAGYDRLVEALRDLGASARITDDVSAVWEWPGLVLATEVGAGEIAAGAPDAGDLLPRTMLLDAFPNAGPELDRSGVLGSVAADGLSAWRRGATVGEEVDVLYGLCDVVPGLGASRRLLASRSYCVLEADDPAQVPVLLLRYLDAASARRR